MNTKLEKAIERCKKGAPGGTCNSCSCDERECLENLKEELSYLEISG